MTGNTTLPTGLIFDDEIGLERITVERLGAVPAVRPEILLRQNPQGMEPMDVPPGTAKAVALLRVAIVARPSPASDLLIGCEHSCRELATIEIRCMCHDGHDILGAQNAAHPPA